MVNNGNLRIIVEVLEIKFEEIARIIRDQEENIYS